MIILYIPFYEENDLVTSAIEWKKTLGDKNILILEHGKRIDYKPFSNEHLTIYILAHGIDDQIEHFHLASSSSITKKTSYLDIEQIADRFNSDFTYVRTKVKNIKLYFCNNKGNQKTIAERFNKNLILIDTPIDYYAGTLFSPFRDKKKYSHYHGQWHISSNVHNTLYQRTPLELDYRISIKERTQLEFLENAKQKRIDFLFERQRKTRHERLRKTRGELLEKHKLEREEMQDEASRINVSPLR